MLPSDIYFCGNRPLKWATKIKRLHTKWRNIWVTWIWHTKSMAMIFKIDIYLLKLHFKMQSNCGENVGGKRLIVHTSKSHKRHWNNQNKINELPFIVTRIQPSDTQTAADVVTTTLCIFEVGSDHCFQNTKLKTNPHHHRRDTITFRKKSLHELYINSTRT